MSRITASPFRLLLCCLIVVLVTSPAWSQQTEKKKKKKKRQEKAAATAQAKSEATPAAAEPTPTTMPPAAQPAAGSEKSKSAGSEPGTTAPVSRGPLKIELSLSGNLESTAMSEISIAPKQWTQLVVVEAVTAGTRVTKGQQLLKLDTSKIEDAVRDLESSRVLADVSLRVAVENYKLLEKTTPIDGEQAERARRNAEQDYENYTKIDAPQAKKAAEFQLKSAEQNLEYVSEELKQLEKMYKADDLTEETEEIILKRARNDVDRSQHFAEQARLRHERTIGFDLPRAAEQQKYTLQQAQFAFNRAQITLPSSLLRAKLELDKMQLDAKRSEEKLAELRRDRDMLVVKAPAAGIVHYGRSQNGKWITATAMAQKFRPGGQILPYEILFTIVSDGGWLVRSSISEKELPNVQVGMSGHLKLVAMPKTRVPVKVKEIANVPATDGSFEITFEVAAPPPQTTVAGMSGEVKLTSYFSADSLTVPSKAVFADESNEDQQYVYIAGPQGKPEKRTVTTGHTKSDMTEILSGLTASDKVFLQKPAP